MTLIISVAKSDETEKASPVIRILVSCQSFGNFPPCQWVLDHSLRCTTLALTATCTTEALTTHQQAACGHSLEMVKQTNQKLSDQFHLQREKNSTTLSLWSTATCNASMAPCVAMAKSFKNLKQYSAVPDGMSSRWCGVQSGTNCWQQTLTDYF